MTKTRHPLATVSTVVRRLCGLVAQLEQIFPDRNFTLDGHLVGSIGEVLAARVPVRTLIDHGAPAPKRQTLPGHVEAPNRTDRLEHLATWRTGATRTSWPRPPLPPVSSCLLATPSQP